MAFDKAESKFASEQFTLRREDKHGVISLVCDGIDEFYIAVLSEDEIVPAIERGLIKVMGSRGHKHVQVTTNGPLDGPVITSIAQPV